VLIVNVPLAVGSPKLTIMITLLAPVNTEAILVKSIVPAPAAEIPVASLNS
jgi:hypothetical protein